MRPKGKNIENIEEVLCFSSSGIVFLTAFCYSTFKLGNILSNPKEKKAPLIHLGDSEKVPLQPK